MEEFHANLFSSFRLVFYQKSISGAGELSALHSICAADFIELRFSVKFAQKDSQEIRFLLEVSNEFSPDDSLLTLAR